MFVRVRITIVESLRLFCKDLTKKCAQVGIIVYTMFRRPSKKREIILRVLTYLAMTISVLAIVSILIFLILGYRLDTNNGKIEQGALLQLNSIPSGATISVDGVALGSRTPTKTTVLGGMHTFTMQRKGYETWTKTITITAGTLTWLDYARLVPLNRPVQSVETYPTLYNSVATSDGKSIIIQQSASIPSFQVIDLRSDKVNSTTLTIPANEYSNAATPNETHTFSIKGWDDGGRYILLKHTYGDKIEWLVMDTHDGNATKNITSVFDLPMTNVVFSGTSGNILYALTGTDVRQLDLSAGTISRSLVPNVHSFSLFSTNIITYEGTDPIDPNKTVVGFYREGDDASHILRSVTTTPGLVLTIATAHYFNKDYIAIAQDKNVNILSGSYPSVGSDNSTLTTFASFIFPINVSTLSFSPNGDYLLVQSGAQFASYDIEHMRLTKYNVTTDPALTVAPVKWIDDDRTWTDYTTNLIMREFDGDNATTINHVVAGQAVAISQNDKYLYSVNKVANGYSLQRVLMILP
jgi:hypothetical protein